VSEAIIVGAGPNGLACAAALAARGVGVTVLEAAQHIGGGARSSELTLPGLIHDDCSAVHALAVSSPALVEHDLERYGLRWRYPEVDLAHPLDGGEAAVLVRSLAQTAAALGVDGDRWRALFGAIAADFTALEDEITRPLLHVPAHPLLLARFGMRAAAPASVLGRSFSTEPARALFGGAAAHAFSPLSWPLSSSVGLALIAACHRYGWPVAEGGSGAITQALAAVIREHGGRIETGAPVSSLAQLPRADAIVLDLTPDAVAAIAGPALPPRVARAYRRYRHGPGAFKVDLALEGGVPWVADAARRAGTVHVAGSFAEILDAERDVNRGRMPRRPFVLVGQQYLADPTRSRGDSHPVWAYAHVPSNYDGDATETLLDAIERFAPGLRERILARHVRGPAQLQAFNANYVGGDIIGGANTPKQMLLRPRIARDPYATGIPGVFICSAATPPGAGAHGLCGWNAAKSALASIERG
jgi:phytoene dehydrogenase-like protein